MLQLSSCTDCGYPKSFQIYIYIEPQLLNINISVLVIILHISLANEKCYLKQRHFCPCNNCVHVLEFFYMRVFEDHTGFSHFVLGVFAIFVNRFWSHFDWSADFGCPRVNFLHSTYVLDLC